jgi:hypothetical protein
MIQGYSNIVFAATLDARRRSRQRLDETAMISFIGVLLLLLLLGCTTAQNMLIWQTGFCSAARLRS